MFIPMDFLRYGTNFESAARLENGKSCVLDVQFMFGCFLHNQYVLAHRKREYQSKYYKT